jgi:hypothetical protein
MSINAAYRKVKNERMPKYHPRIENLAPNLTIAKRYGYFLIPS